MSDCVLFEGRARRGRGSYGAVTVNGRSKLAHRLAYEAAFGPIPEGFDVHHECENTLCVNPEHLGVALRGQHRRLHHRRDACKRGHPIVTTSGGWRYCRTCNTERARAKRRRDRDVVHA